MRSLENTLRRRIREWISRNLVEVSVMQPGWRPNDPSHPPAPQELLELGLDLLDMGWEMSIAVALASGATREEAEREVAHRWKLEDAQRLKEKKQCWEELARARRCVL